VGTGASDLELTIPALPRVAAANALHLSQCAADARSKFEALLAASLRAGRPLGIVQSRRYDSDQFILFQKGRKFVGRRWVVTDAGLVITNARTAKDSAHGCICGVMHGKDDGCARAIDVCFLVDGKVVGPKPGKGNDSYDTELPWTWLGELGESVGLEWGGRFPFADLGHFQQPGWRALRDAAAAARAARTA
jgi:hypothetical protein